MGQRKKGVLHVNSSWLTYIHSSLGFCRFCRYLYRPHDWASSQVPSDMKQGNCILVLDIPDGVGPVLLVFGILIYILF